MPRISPFAGLLFDEGLVGPLEGVTAPPYDTIGEEQLRHLRGSSPYNIVHLDLSEARVDDDANDNQYTRAATLLRRWRDEGAVRPSPSPAFYPYEMRFRYEGTPRRIRGLICRVELEPWGGSIVPHERTMPGPVEDRLRLLREVRTNLSPVYALSPGPREGMAAFLDRVTRQPAPHGVVDEAGVEHRLWVVEDSVPDLPVHDSLLIADGHHRYTMALRFREEMRAAHGPGPWDHVMMYIVDAAVERPPVLPIHRVLLDGPAPSSGERVRDLEELCAALDDEALTYGIVRRDHASVVHEIGRLEGEPPTVCALTDQVDGLDDTRALRFTHDPVEAEDAVRSGEAPAAYLLPATSAERIRAVVDSRDRMPEKSTYFWPKPRTGMVLRPLDDR
jgi:uncharacterized protein (DUF1015 family)